MLPSVASWLVTCSQPLPLGHVLVLCPSRSSHSCGVLGLSPRSPRAGLDLNAALAQLLSKCRVGTAALCTLPARSVGSGDLQRLRIRPGPFPLGSS